MKGTLFSADFIEDSNGDLRLLEVNTDTQAVNLQFFDYSEFVDVLSQNNITKVVVVHKPHIHQEMVNHLSASLNVSASFITSFTEVKEGPNVLYPTSVNDEADLFVLRLAYDESSIFDSEYAKSTLNLLSLFADYGDAGSVTEFYHSSSVTGYYNTIQPEFNPNNIPDYLVKNSSKAQSFANFYKVGSESETDTNQSRFDEFISQTNTDNVVIEKYHINPNTITDNKVSSIRAYSIIYGGNLSLIHLCQFKAYSVFELPTVSIYDEEKYVNKIDNKHYYEFATNIIKYEGVFDGILNTHLIIKSDDTDIAAGDISVGDSLKSYYIGVSSLDENNFYNKMNWEITGSSLPTGSYITSSIVVYKNTKQLENKTICNITVNDNTDSIFVGPLKSFLVYNSVDDVIKWKPASQILENVDYLIDFDGDTAQVTSNDVMIINEDGFSLVEIDVEDTDTYIISGSTPINSFVTHNAPCFVAGTKVMLSDGSLKNIENINSGDLVSTYDIKENKIIYNIVKNVFSKSVDKIVKYTFENGETLSCTIDHPIYINDKGWASFDNELSNNLYSIEESIKKIEIGDSVKLHNGDTKISNIELIEENTIVYNLQDIENNHNYFANNVLVHNRFCFVAGTKVKMLNGSEKNIEDIIIGDEVVSYNEVTKEKEIKTVTEIKSPVHKELVKYIFSNNSELICTTDHPIYVNGLNLASYDPDLTTKRYDLNREILGIQVGDKVNLHNGENVEIVSIESLPIEDVQTYIITVADNSNFYANDVLVHNKCFVAGTLITLLSGENKNIEDIEIGEKVLTFNEFSNKNEEGVVGDLKQHEVSSVVKLEFDNGILITTTNEHPFFVKNRGWVEAKELSTDDLCLGIDGNDVMLVIKEELEEVHKVYNLLSVSENHNFYANGILVHNKV